MSVDREKQVQARVKDWLIKDMHYDFIGNLIDQDNTPVIEKTLYDNLIGRGYDEKAVGQAVSLLIKTASIRRSGITEDNKEIYSLLRYGAMGVKDKNDRTVTVHYIDWEHPENNAFSFAEEVTVRRHIRTDRVKHKRPDLILYINGIAVVMIELKRSDVSIGEGIRQMLTNQKDENIRDFFSTIQLLIAGNEAEGVRYGVVETEEKYYLKWKEEAKAADNLSDLIRRKNSEDNNRLRHDLISLCTHERLLMLIHDFMIFDAGRKKTARHNQFFAVLAAQTRIMQNEGGIIWNTQGSGKSLIMVWLAKWIREHIDNSRVVIITDREELDDQIEGVFHKVGENKVKRAKSCENLRTILNTNDTDIICSLIHKYGHNAGKQADIDQYTKELLKDLPRDYEAKGNIIAFIDECHRTNSGKLHKAVRLLMPKAILIGFTGTPLLKTDKQTSLETFGTYIHTYKFDEGVEDGVILDLRYEARDVDQFLSSPDKVDRWFEAKTKSLTEHAKMQLKQRWTTLNKLYSAKERLEIIAREIIFDMETLPRLSNDRGTAMLVADSVYSACRYWEIFQNNGFTKCAVVSSFEPSTSAVRTETSDLSRQNEEEYKKSVYERMLGDKTQAEFEAEAKRQFREEPAKMKLLIVVEKLLTGFDAPSATYLYIDKSMRDHDLFQTICRVNRPDGDDKDYGYIVDYMDLFRNIQTAVNDYTSESFDGFDKEDVEGLIKNRYDEAKAEMTGSLNALQELLSGVPAPKTDSDHVEYFCDSERENSEKAERRESLYALTASLTRSFVNCCEKLTSEYGYTEEQKDTLRHKISEYNRIKEMIKIASCDYIDQKPYEADMRYILDTYIRANDSETISRMEDMSLVELIVNSETTTPEDMIKDIPGDDNAKAESIENNLVYEIVKRKSSNEVYYGKLSEMLDDLIERRKIEAISYKEYLKEVVKLAKAALHPEQDDDYPDEIRNSAARRALYDYLDHDSELTITIDTVIRNGISPRWKMHPQKLKTIRNNIHRKLMEAGFFKEKADMMREKIFDMALEQAEYDRS